MNSDEIEVFICLDCSVNTAVIGEYYMLNFALWKQIHPSKDGMLCIACVELRLNRELTGEDFLDALINVVGLFPPQSPLLVSRIMSGNVKKNLMPVVR